MVKNKLKNNKKLEKITVASEVPFEIVVKRLLDAPPLKNLSSQKKYFKTTR